MRVEIDPGDIVVLSIKIKDAKHGIEFKVCSYEGATASGAYIVCYDDVRVRVQGSISKHGECSAGTIWEKNVRTKK